MKAPQDQIILLWVGLKTMKKRTFIYPNRAVKIRISKGVLIPTWYAHLALYYKY